VLARKVMKTKEKLKVEKDRSETAIMEKER
jgi:hypothetical protein